MQKKVAVMNIIITIVIIIIIVIRIKFACYHIVMHSVKFNYSHYLLIF